MQGTKESSNFIKQYICTGTYLLIKKFTRLVCTKVCLRIVYYIPSQLAKLNLILVVHCYRRFIILKSLPSYIKRDSY